MTTPEDVDVEDLRQRLRNSWLTDSPYADEWRLTDDERASLVAQLDALRAGATEWTEEALWVPVELEAEIREVVDRLIARDFEWLVETGRLDRDAAETVREQLDDYPATFVALPAEAFLIAEYWHWEKDDEVGFVEMPLWSEEEGPSDLETRLIVRPSGLLELYDLLVP